MFIGIKYEERRRRSDFRGGTRPQSEDLRREEEERV